MAILKSVGGAKMVGLSKANMLKYVLIFNMGLLSGL